MPISLHKIQMCLENNPSYISPYVIYNRSKIDKELWRSREVNLYVYLKSL